MSCNFNFIKYINLTKNSKYKNKKCHFFEKEDLRASVYLPIHHSFKLLTGLFVCFKFKFRKYKKILSSFLFFDICLLNLTGLDPPGGGKYGDE